MPQAPYLVSGKVYSIRGTIANSRVLINNDISALTDSSGQFVVDLSNLSSGYIAGSTYNIEAWDELNNEYVLDTFTVSGESLTKNVFLEVREDTNDQTRNSETRRVEVRSIGNKPITQYNPLSVYNLERPLTQKLAYLSGTSQVEYVGDAPPGTPTSSPKWRIKKLVYSGTNTTDILWAKGNAEFTKTWDDRESYNYS